MTIASRNNVFRAGIVLALALLVFTALVSVKVLSWYPAVIGRAQDRPLGLLQSLAARFFRPVPWVPFISICGSLLFSPVSLILILYYFEKTPAPEILFVSFFVFSLSFEAARAMLPLMQARELPGIFGIMAQRALLFGRYAGIFSLFTAGICAAGLELQRQGTIILVILLAGLVLALNMPLDILAWDTSLCLESGYDTMFLLTETCVALIGALSFIVSARSRGSREYLSAGVGAFLAFLGRSLFLRADTWATPFPGLVLLVAGTWLLCGQLHRVYLWL